MSEPKHHLTADCIRFDAMVNVQFAVIANRTRGSVHMRNPAYTIKRKPFLSSNEELLRAFLVESMATHRPILSFRSLTYVTIARVRISLLQSQILKSTMMSKLNQRV